MEIRETIHLLARENYREIVAIRRHLHRHPELSNFEVGTSRFICEKLKKWGIPYKEGVAGTGVVATLTGEKGPGRTIALRADMDALPIQEMNEVDYKSENPGVMHACGHDVHMASLLGTILILNKLKEHFSGEIRCLFQPSEESFPGGALEMIQEGVLENPTPVAIFGQHTLPTLDAGKIGMRPGKYMASTDEVYLVVKGKGGHAATPELNIDPVAIAAQIITALQQIVSRFAPNNIPTLLSFGKVIADGRTNIIPDTVTIEGTFRTYDEKWRAKARERITRMASSIAHGLGGECEVNIVSGYPFLINDPPLTRNAFQHAVDYLGEENVEELDMRMTAEDFAY
ncbi:MAG: M20 family metallopeptidase, partial [Bacteroidetes bacterium]|nr:M20 family metallopeptidase [Bacteroidota bacterium]